MSKFKFHIDPGHGWLEVPIPLINSLGIRSKISNFSFVNAGLGVAYLEEDCDAAIFIHAMKKVNREVRFEDVVHDNRFFGRTYPRWS